MKLQCCSEVLPILYTKIYSKSKPKFKTGAISESTIALNVDQSNTLVLNADVKTATSGSTLPLQSPLAPSTKATSGNNQVQMSTFVGSK
ncbi:hypothetical protein Fmac_001823 [Flemingia macrophylla]|uniref:Uncharacterized protein n=1 Tax=Flemingia macrophylla TaxID=520843 RepID=A0ABD1NJV6_9FABA